MRHFGVVVAAFALASANTGHAQTVYHWPALPAAQLEAERWYSLPIGTPLMLRTRTAVSTKDNRLGDTVNLEVAENVIYRGQIIVPVGAPVVAEVSRLQRNGHVGKKGKIEVRLRYLDTPSGRVNLTGSIFDEGKSGTALSLGTMLLVSGVGGYFIHGTSGYIDADTPVQAHLASPLRFTWYEGAGTEVASTSGRSDSLAVSQLRPR